MKSELRSIQEWYKYNSYVRKKYLQAIFKKIPEKERYKAKGASFPSIVDIFVHVLDAYRFWFLFVYQDRVSEMWRLRERKRYSGNEVVKEERKIDRFVMNFVNRLTTRDLDKDISFRDGNKLYTIELRYILLHMVEEELQHRGEMNALFWQMDIDPPVIGIDDLKQRIRKID